MKVVIKKKCELSFSSLSVNAGQFEQNFGAFENVDRNMVGSFDDKRGLGEDPRTSASHSA